MEITAIADSICCGPTSQVQPRARRVLNSIVSQLEDRVDEVSDRRLTLAQK
ncbi:hypothetical protein M878_25515 [Streptomyces roseochromogenus subsp. oscitans DS 12.976]|uniref:Uncharacterized protein n=1 Tax=Streptomyces roseochromogenus subsp. oscitans DS 12.976 TaxID=1352936 RepID=V6K598_STRRC|nr:hypothetical protein M878_25515 [Streptomyces roseochromogenus subsp. oscitans DS 12.976]